MVAICHTIRKFALLSFAHCITLARLPKKYARLALGKHTAALAKASRRTRREKDKWEPVTLPDVAQGSHFRPYCHKTFTTRAADASHQSTRHKVGTVSETVSGSKCFVCRQQWWSTYRLKEHLRRSGPCRNAWNNADLDTLLPFETIGRRQDKAWRPPTVVEGPQHPFKQTSMIYLKHTLR